MRSVQSRFVNKVQMVGVHRSGPTNSQPFTNCCGLAITERESRCPGCKREVVPGDAATQRERYERRHR